MKVVVTLNAALRRYVPEGRADNTFDFELGAGATVADLLDRLEIPSQYTKMIMAGEEQLTLSSPLFDGQHIGLYPPLAGG